MAFSLDLSGLFDYAAQIFNGLSPIIALVGGLSLGVALVMFVLRAVKNIF